MTNKLQLLSC